jgi:hypothetical protein
MSSSDYYTQPVGSDQHRDAYSDLHAEAAEVGCEVHPDADVAYDLENSAELAAELSDERGYLEHYAALDDERQAELDAAADPEPEAEPAAAIDREMELF